MSEERVDIAFKRIDELREKLNEVEKIAVSAKNLASYVGQSNSEIHGLLSTHKAEVKGIIDSWVVKIESVFTESEKRYKDTLESYRKAMEISLEKYTTESKNQLTKAINRFLIYLLGGGSIIVVALKLIFG